ncbi:MAG: SH3 domain-containing protein [Anaerolineaceae bacterium]|nr:SH3 domain-containing protein [Anaerolineaceae bacterium]
MRKTLWLVWLLCCCVGISYAQEEAVEPIYFEQTFAEGIPEDWQVDGAWEAEAGTIRSATGGDLIQLPGSWADFSLAMRLRNSGPGIRSIVFRANELGSYQLHFRSEGVGLLFTDQSGIPTFLDWLPGINHDDWHDLVIIAESNRLFILLNGESLFDYEAPEETALWEGAVAFYNLVAGEFEIDSLSIAPIILSPAVLAPKWMLAAPPPLAETAVETRTATATPPQTAIQFTLNGGEEALTINAGECIVLQWRVTHATAVFFNGERTQDSGLWQECPRQSVVFTLRVLKADASEEQRALLVHVIQPTPTRAIPTPTPAAAVGACRLTPDRLNMNLREGDSTDYPIVGRLNLGNYAIVVGRNLEDTWYRVEFEGLDAWVAGRGYTRLEGDCSYTLLRIYEPRPLPPTNTPPPPAPVRENPSFQIQGLNAFFPTFNVDGVHTIYIPQGQCVTLLWYADGINALYYQGSGVAGPSGERNECPNQTTTYHLRVEMRDGSVRDLYARAIIQ